VRIEAVVAEADNSFRRVALEWDSCVAIGYAGRDQKSVMAHVEELKALGVPAPSSVPSMYWIDPSIISSNDELQVVGDACSGEVEFFAAFDGAGEMYFTVASDHTDRKLETVSVSKAKQGCSKIIGGVFWRFADAKDHWDDITLRSWVKAPGKPERIYQDGKLAMLLEPAKLAELARADAPAGKKFSYLSGTIPLAGEICYEGEFIMELSDPRLGRSVRHSYKTVRLPDRN
jgi:hypothetical protein